ncbi:hypothetical protein EJQ19_11215 [Paenibacillus whitsoniae]|uniref:Uncharacterized protein n=1 Tax=Paenibacillus whitsoniae TaxID=2496558 RepID=A0A430JF03_9BACL|nr:hypothetical protein EJQ19_11215 [Paenibacillus whitsoniae]
MYICHVCGFNKLDEPPWGDDGKTASFSICSCCGVEFGYEDATEKGLINYRDKWLNNGAKWFNESKRPESWDVQEQLKRINFR